MGPNQNINISGTGATGAAPVQSTPAASSENIMAQGVSEKKKGGKGMLYGMILCAVLAVGGIGFGVWTWMDGNTQKDSLNQQISDLKKKNSELLDRIAEYENKIEEEPEIEDSSENFYIEEWGLSIKLPDSISDIEYEIGNGYSDICDSGVTIKSLIRDGKKIDAGELEGVAFIKRCTEMFPYGTLVFEDDAFKYYYEFPNGLSIEDPQEVQDAADDLKNVLNNKENYSKI